MIKECPTCKRTYADHTYAFCLADGALLSAPYDPQATQVLNAPTAVQEVLPTIPAVEMETLPANAAGPHPGLLPTVKYEPSAGIAVDPVTAIERSAAEEETRRRSQRTGTWVLFGLGLVSFLAAIYTISWVPAVGATVFLALALFGGLRSGIPKGDG